jgi:hypothetical protein
MAPLGNFRQSAYLQETALFLGQSEIFMDSSNLLSRLIGIDLIGLPKRMRFANIFPCVDWAKSCLDKWDTFDKKVQESLLFLKEQKEFIEPLVEIGKIFKWVCAVPIGLY